MLVTREIDDYSQLMDLQGKWANVLEKSKDNNIFLTWEWLSTWWKHYGRGRKLVVLLAEDGNEIAAIAPFMYTVHRVIGYRLGKIELLGARHTDYCNVILAEQKAESLSLILKHLSNLSWDILELKGIRESAESIPYLRRMFGEAHMQLEERTSSKCVYTNLPDTWEAFFKGLGRNMRRNIRRRMKQLTQEYRVGFTKETNVDSLEEAMRTFFHLHQKRWRSKGMPGSFGEDPRFRNFLLDISRCFADNGWLNLSFLTLDDEPISSALCFEYNNTLYYYHPGFNPAYSRFGVGNLLIAHLIEYSIRKGLKTFDFLNGDESYKYDWTAVGSRNIALAYVRNHFLPIIYNRAKRSANLFPKELGRYKRFLVKSHG